MAIDLRSEIHDPYSPGHRAQVSNKVYVKKPSKNAHKSIRMSLRSLKYLEHKEANHCHYLLACVAGPQVYGILPRARQNPARCKSGPP